MQRWFPDVDVWVWCLVFGAVLFGVAYIFAVIELAQERRARRRKEAHNA
jgi:hypothetical protein